MQLHFFRCLGLSLGDLGALVCAQLHLDEALKLTSHRRGNVKDIAKGFKGESRQVLNYRIRHTVFLVTDHRTKKYLVCQVKYIAQQLIMVFFSLVL